MGVKSIVLFAGLFIGLAVACSSGSEESATTQNDSSSSNGSATAISATNFDTCTGLIDLEYVQIIAGRPGNQAGKPTGKCPIRVALGHIVARD